MSIEALAQAFGCAQAPLSALLDASAFGKLSKLEFCALAAQCAHESQGFSRTRENMNYSPSGLRATWPNRFTEIEANVMGRTKDHPADVVRIANKAYNGRMGNLEGTDDGYDFRGGGYIQLTGRANYARFAAACPRFADVAMLPEKIAQADASAAVAVWYWKASSLGVVLDRQGFQAVSNYINTGNTAKTAHGSEERIRLYAKARVAMGV